MTLKQTAIACTVTAVVVAATTKYYFPQVQTKTVEITKEVVKTDVQTVVHTIRLPSGAEDTTTTIIDHTVKLETDKKTELKLAPTNWVISGAVMTTDIRTLTPKYGLQVQRRILGPAFIGVLVDTKGGVGVSLGFEF